MRKQMLVEVEKPRSDGLFYVPDNCWAFDAETKKLVTGKTLTAEQAKRTVLVPKIAGGSERKRGDRTV